MALQAVALTDIRNYIKKRISYAKYYIGSTGYDATINNIEVQSDGTVRVTLVINPTAAATVTKVELYNTDSQLWASQEFSVKLTGSAQKILYWFEFTVKEKEAS